MSAMSVRKRAASTARIFDVIAMVVLGLGGVAVFAQLVAVVVMVASGDGEFFVVLGFVGALITAALTLVAWACVTLSTVVAGYIAERTV